MSPLTRSITRLLLLSLLIAVAGCQDPNEGMNADEQAAQAAADRIKELEDLYGQADQARILAEEDALRLRTELDQLKDELAQRPASPAEGWSVVPGGAMTSLDGTVLFDSGKAILKSAGRHTLDQVVRVILEEFPDHEVYIFGHTDSQPIRKSGWKDNYELSCQRALSVLRHLKDKGAMQYMAACGWGQHRPVADNRTAKARQANRRVEIFAMAPEEPMAGAARAGRP